MFCGAVRAVGCGRWIRSGNAAVADYRAARKYSVTIAGHETSIRIEPAFWAMVNAGAATRGIPVNAMVARIDSERIATQQKTDSPPNLASAIRLWVLAEMTPESDPPDP